MAFSETTASNLFGSPSSPSDAQDPFDDLLAPTTNHEHVQEERETTAAVANEVEPELDQELGAPVRDEESVEESVPAHEGEAALVEAKEDDAGVEEEKEEVEEPEQHEEETRDLGKSKLFSPFLSSLGGLWRAVVEDWTLK